MISENAKELLSEINNHSGNKLKFIGELEFIIESSFQTGKSNIFEEIIFTGKYLNGLKSIFEKENGTEDSVKLIPTVVGRNISITTIKMLLPTKSGSA